MKQLMETLYILTPDSYVFHRNDNICVSIGGEEKASVPAGRRMNMEGFMVEYADL